VLQRIGTFEGGKAKETYSVVPGSATGELQSLQGNGSYTSSDTAWSTLSP
jgi:hypothetical protein